MIHIHVNKTVIYDHYNESIISSSAAICQRPYAVHRACGYPCSRWRILVAGVLHSKTNLAVQEEATGSHPALRLSFLPWSFLFLPHHTVLRGKRIWGETAAYTHDAYPLCSIPMNCTRCDGKGAVGIKRSPVYKRLNAHSASASSLTHRHVLIKDIEFLKSAPVRSLNRGAGEITALTGYAGGTKASALASQETIVCSLSENASIWSVSFRLARMNTYVCLQCRCQYHMFDATYGVAKLRH
eukprot:2213679-Amphidinium_carterae.1